MCRTRTVDVSGDGLNNRGLEPQAVYGTHFPDEVTVNALLVTFPTREQNTTSIGQSARLEGWFQSAVLHGPGPFLVVARGFEDYGRAMTAKLRSELEMPLVSGWPTSPGAG